MRPLKFLPILTVLVILCSCVPPETKEQNSVNIDLSSKQNQRILTHRLDKTLDSLFYYLNSDNANHRFLAAGSFDSQSDEAAIKKKLIEKLSDNNIDIRTRAAYGLAQSRDASLAKTLMGFFKQRDTISVDNKFNAQIIQSMGDLGDEKVLRSLSTISTYRPTDTLLLVAQTRAIYKMTLRGINSASATSLMVSYVTNPEIPIKARLYAAHYLSRSSELDIEQHKFQIANQMIKEKDVNVKMALGLALKHTQDPDIQNIINSTLEGNEDYRVKINLIRALQNYDYINSIEIIMALLSDENQKLALTAASYIANGGNKEDSGIYRTAAQNADSTILKPKLYEAFFQAIPYYYTKTRNAARYDIQQLLELEQNPRMISAYLSALGQDINSYELINKVAEESNDAIVLSAAARALGSILSNERFNANFKGSSRYARRKILGYLETMFEKKDIGVYTETALALANPKSEAKLNLDSLRFLRSAYKSLQFPEDLEAGLALAKAVNFLTDSVEIKPPKSAAFKKLNFGILEKVQDSTRAMVKTTKGVFELVFFPESAPSSVVNFIELSNDNYYDDKVFHRVVPNFVIQTGCNRGDGYGSLPFTIPSELGPKYYDDAGYVGMASAGIDTESSQWFVTHSPTPHLDGRYTIFAKVIQGMNVVHDIEEGDKILDVIIKNL